MYILNRFLAFGFMEQVLWNFLNALWVKFHHYRKKFFLIEISIIQTG